MTRRSFFRVLLSLLLLMSQQMAIAHAMTHWAGARDGAAQAHRDQDNGQAKAVKQQHASAMSAAFAQDQTCEQCLTFAQIAGAIGSAACSVTVERPVCCAVSASPTQAGCARTTCVFQPRAPPFLA